MTGTVGILNVGAGDIALSFDPANPVERIRAARVVKDMIRRGFALLIEVERDGEKRFERALDFDEKNCRYIIADFDPEVARDADRVEQELSRPLAQLAIDRGMENDHGESVTTEDTPHPASDGAPASRGRPKKYRASVDAGSTKAVAVGRSAGG